MTSVPIRPEIIELLGEREDLAELVNSVLLTYASGGFFRRSDVAGVIDASRVFRRAVDLGADVYDATTQEFKGVSVVGEKVSEGIMVLSAKFMKLLEDNQVIVVMKTPRAKGISVEKIDSIFIPVPRAEMV